MKTLKQSALLCAMAAMLAACGDSAQTEAPKLAVTVTSKSSAEVVQAPAAYHELVQRVYVAYFGRPADPGGLTYFAGLMSSYNGPTGVSALADAYYSNPSLRAIMEVFSNSQESIDLYAGDNGVFINAVYRNLFGRDADEAGKTYWVDLLNAGTMTRVNAAVQIMAGALGTDVLAINKRVSLAAKYTASVNTPPRLIATEGNAASAAARALLATLNLGSDVNAYQPQIDAVLADLVSKAAPAGLYSGKLTSNSTPLDLLVLDDGSFFGFYSGMQSIMYPNGFLQGKGVWNQGAFNSTDIKDFGGAPSTDGDIGASYVAQTSFNGTFGVPGGSAAFTSSVSNPAVYDYFSTATTAQIAGQWSLFEAGSDKLYYVTIEADGKISGGVTGCTFSGQLSPRAAGKNVLNAAITYAAGANTCRLAGQSAVGVVYSLAPSSTFPRRLFMAVTNLNRTAGSAYYTALVSQDTVVGTGAAAVFNPPPPPKTAPPPPIANSTATMHYTGYLYNGNGGNIRGAQFDSSVGKTPFTFVVGTGNVITGWHYGIHGMRPGGKRTLILPPQYGYGTQGSGSIPPNSTLVFDVEMVSLK